LIDVVNGIWNTEQDLPAMAPSEQAGMSARHLSPAPRR
jgi:hypothetical protein